MVYFVLPYRPEEWKNAESNPTIDPEEFQQQLKQMWPDCTVYEPTSDSPYAVRSELREDDETILFGGLQKDRKTVSVEPSGR